MVHLALLAFAVAITGGCILLMTGAKAGALASAWRGAAAAFILGGLSAALFVSADVLPGDGDLANGSLEFLGLLLWLVSIPMEIAAVAMVARAWRRPVSTLVLPCLVLALAFAATWYRTLLG